MNRLPRKLSFSIAAALTLAGCSQAAPDDESTESVQQAVMSVCSNSTGVYFVDGVPAYAQCTASSNSPIYSNNGIDTATSATASDWKQTQSSGGYQCTELLHRYWLFHWNIKWIPNGNADNWCDTIPPATSGLEKTTSPVHGDAIVFAPGVCGADATYGHVALIDTVDTANSKVTFVEQNNAGRRTSAWSCATCFLHVVANTGAGGAAGSGGATYAGAGGTTVQLSTSATTGGRTSIGGATFAGGSTATNNTVLPKGGTTTLAAGTSGNSGSTLAANVGGAVVVSTAPVESLGGTSAIATTTSSSPAVGGGTPSSLTSSEGTALSPDNTADPVAGCSCSVPSRSPVSAFTSLLMGAVGIFWLRRRRG